MALIAHLKEITKKVVNFMNSTKEYDTEEKRIKYWEDFSKYPKHTAVSSLSNQGAEVKRMDKFIKFHFNMKDEVVLDCGVGIGRFLPTLERCGAKEIIGVDISAGMIRRAKEKAKELKIPVKFIVSQLENLDKHLLENSVDTVFSMVVIRHITDKNCFEKALTNLKRIARKRVIIFCDGMTKTNREKAKHCINWFPEDYIKVFGDNWKVKRLDYTHLPKTYKGVIKKRNGIIFERDVK